MPKKNRDIWVLVTRRGYSFWNDAKKIVGLADTLFENRSRYKAHLIHWGDIYNTQSPVYLERALSLSDTIQDKHAVLQRLAYSIPRFIAEGGTIGISEDEVLEKIGEYELVLNQRYQDCDSSSEYMYPINILDYTDVQELSGGSCKGFRDSGKFQIIRDDKKKLYYFMINPNVNRDGSPPIVNRKFMARRRKVKPYWNRPGYELFWRLGFENLWNGKYEKNDGLREVTLYLYPYAYDESDRIIRLVGRLPDLNGYRVFAKCDK